MAEECISQVYNTSSDKLLKVCVLTIMSPLLALASFIHLGKLVPCWEHTCKGSKNTQKVAFYRTSGIILATISVLFTGVLLFSSDLNVYKMGKSVDLLNDIDCSIDFIYRKSLVVSAVTSVISMLLIVIFLIDLGVTYKADDTKL